jgi:3-hydroxyacyl-CoA dehydrogenase
MTFEERLQNVSVLGAAGKMGSGILFLTLIEMADLSLKPENIDKSFVLNAIDVSHKGLSGLMEYLRSQVRKVAEKKTIQLRQVYSDRADLIENGEIIDQYIFDVMKIVRPITSLEASYSSTLIFEAINEDENLKAKILGQIDQNNPNEPWFFTNTSSIPIHHLDTKINLKGRIIGFHFYNPPAVQKLVEVISAKNTKTELAEFASQYAKKLRKVVVPSNDVAGFIGNGHFMRDILFAVQEVEKLTAEMSFAEAVYIINKITQDFLIRPMGIFQLIDYVGIDVCQFIMNVMNTYIPEEEIHCSLLDKLVTAHIKGGQNSDSSQKDGIIKYEKNKLAAIFDINFGKYVPISEIQTFCDEKLGKMPTDYLAWKSVISIPNKDEFLRHYFTELNSMQTFGAKLAIKYLQYSKKIGLDLISQNVAKNKTDANTVLLTGFFHAYGPIHDYI